MQGNCNIASTTIKFRNAWNYISDSLCGIEKAIAKSGRVSGRGAWWWELPYVYIRKRGQHLDQHNHSPWGLWSLPTTRLLSIFFLLHLSFFSGNIFERLTSLDHHFFTLFQLILLCREIGLYLYSRRMFCRSKFFLSMYLLTTWTPDLYRRLIVPFEWSFLAVTDL